MKVTRNIIDQGQTCNGGWTREQLALLNVSWPPHKHWKNFVVGREYPEDHIKRFLEIGKATYPLTPTT